MKFTAVCIVAALAALPVRAQDCFDGLPISPATGTSSSQYWGRGGIDQSGQDLFLASDSLSKISIMRPNSSGTMVEVNKVNAPSLSHFAANGDVLAVASATITSNGQVLVYTKAGASDQYMLTTTITSTQSGKDFGRRVAVSEDGNTLAVSAPGTVSTEAGRVYIYGRSPSGVWSLSGSLAVTGSKQLGKYLSFWGTRLAMTEGASDKVHVFERQGTTYALTASFSNQSANNFARGMVMSQDTIVVRSLLGSSSLYDDRFEIHELIDGSWTRTDSLNLSGSIDFDFEAGVLSVSFTVGNSLQARCYRKQGVDNEWSNFFTGSATYDTINNSGAVSVEGERVAIAEPYRTVAAGGGSISSAGAAFLFDAVYVDCNGNGRRDECDIAAGSSGDSNANLVPDECENSCQADFNGDGIVDGADLGRLLTNWGACP
jgi:hypothetical protein